MFRTIFGWVTVLGCALLLTACGFELRGASDYAFKRLYIASSNTQLSVDIQRNIRYGSKGTVVVTSPKDADARLEILSVSQSRAAVSLNTSGQAREYELSSITTFQLVTPDGTIVIPRSEIRLVRNLPYSDSESTARDTESALLYRDMLRDTVDQIIRRMEAVKAMPAPSAS
ncbi:LPS-assembly lipoprotein LptE [Pandoraea terrae]|uniref:LPS-assembly lipoprotein LptE n=1 Tax=Pandoraea terrae TaxID=1537710 RepID=A0A5E4Z3G3_9BURK|nr:LPS assembly lipoprotein LptE [Pandoraea terrae]VVE55791.1 LPS-assembly lipoprotein LptE [Pandoraea terrae]